MENKLYVYTVDGDYWYYAQGFMLASSEKEVRKRLKDEETGEYQDYIYKTEGWDNIPNIEDWTKGIRKLKEIFTTNPNIEIISLELDEEDIKKDEEEE